MSRRCSTTVLAAVTVILPTLLPGTFAAGDDWPTFRHDARRSAVSTEDLRAPLVEAWTFASLHPPSHAWGDPQPKPVEDQLELPRLRFDDAFHVAVSNGLVCFGSSADNAVYGLDAATGEIRWKRITDGPVRLAPTLRDGRAYVGSDDGKVWCLDASDGRPLWVFAAAPGPEMLLGNGKMISRWPVRTGVVVEDGVAWFGAGVFPAEGVYLYAVDADDGKLLWKNDSYGRGGQGTVSPQGYMILSPERLFVPSGRAMPAAFARKDGTFLFHRNFSWRDIGMFGGTAGLLSDGLLLTAIEQVVAVREANGGLAFTEGIPAGVPTDGARQIAAEGDEIYLVTGQEALGLRRAAWVADRGLADLQRQLAALVQRARGNDALKGAVADLEKRVSEAAAAAARPEGERAVRWRTPCQANESIALSRAHLFAGGDGKVVGLERATGREVWSGRVEGKVRGLAIADGRLFASTDRGTIACFRPATGAGGGAGTSGPRRVSPRVVESPFAPDDAAPALADTAARLLEENGARRGFALVVGAGGERLSGGRLALELVRRSELVVYLVEPDFGTAARCRDALDAAGVHGARAVVLAAALDAVPLPDYFANLLVANDPIDGGAPAIAADEALRMLKPWGGVAFAGRLAGDPPAGDAEGGAPAAPSELEAWLAPLRMRGPETGVRVASSGARARISRGPLPGAGSWTHEYAEPGNTATSDDLLVKGPIGILWYGEPGPRRMPSRHSANVAPLALGGRVFMQGEHVVMAHDAFNGLRLWEREIPGALRLNVARSVSNFAASEDGLFVAVGGSCLRLDLATGEVLKAYSPPPAPDGAALAWLYVAVKDRILYGTRGTSTLFAVDIPTGDLLWRHDAGNLQVMTIAVGDGRIHVVDRVVTEEQKALALKDVAEETRLDQRGKPVAPDVRRVLTLDSRTGAKVWEKPLYISDCVGIGASGGDLAAMCSRGVLLLCGQPWNGHFWKEFFAGEFSRRSLIALSAEDGKLLWTGRKGYRSRPLIVGDTIIAEPWAHDLFTGAEKLRPNPVTGESCKWQMARPGHHCGNIAAAPGALFFRSGTTAYYDLEGDYGTAHFGAQRPGCWINCIPANGVVAMPEASSGCICPFSLQCTIVFEPRKESRVWGMFSAPGPLTPVRRLAVCFGAPGDRKDSTGALWIAYPRPWGGVNEVERRLVLDLPLEVTLAPGGGYFAGDPEEAPRGAEDTQDAGDRPADGTAAAGPPPADPWVYASGVTGLLRCAVPVGAAGAPPESYTVRVHLAERTQTAGAARAFRVAVQGTTAIERLEIAGGAAGHGRPIVRELRGVRAAEKIEIDLAPIEGATILCGLEVVRE